MGSIFFVDENFLWVNFFLKFEHGLEFYLELRICTIVLFIGSPNFLRSTFLGGKHFFGVNIFGVNFFGGNIIGG